MRRVLVIGPGGAGKSTLAKQIGERTGLPVIHLDALYWHPGWVPTPDAEWRSTVEKLVTADEWVMDGNYGGTLDIRLPAADTVVFLDVPRHTCIARVLRRWVRHARYPRPDMAPGCAERFSPEFLAWIWNYRRRRRPQILRRLQALAPTTSVHVLRTPRDVALFLEGVTRDDSAHPGSGASRGVARS